MLASVPKKFNYILTVKKKYAQVSNPWTVIVNSRIIWSSNNIEHYHFTCYGSRL
jgi:hypothetical protein